MANKYMQDINARAQGLSELIAAGERAKQAQEAEMMRAKQAQESEMQRLITSGQQRSEQDRLRSQDELERLNRSGQQAKELVRLKAQLEAEQMQRNPAIGKERMMPLTPAQGQAEKEAGKAIAKFEIQGGRPTLQKNIAALEEGAAELGGAGFTAPGVKKRDAYDRIVGGLSSKIGLQAFLAPTEKARADKIRNTALTIARQTDPNPTEKQIEAIMGQVYDPASSNEENLARIMRFKSEQEGQASQLEDASRRYHETGYASIGVGSPVKQQQAEKSSELQQLIQMQQELLRKKQGK